LRFLQTKTGKKIAGFPENRINFLVGPPIKNLWDRKNEFCLYKEELPNEAL
jgi:hypothetical protein